MKKENADLSVNRVLSECRVPRVNLDLRVFKEIKAAPDLKVNKEYKDLKGISGLKVKKVKLGLKENRAFRAPKEIRVKLGLRAKKARLGLRENRAFRGSKAKKGIPVKRPQLQLSKIRLSAIN